MKMNKKLIITVSSVAIASVLGFGIYHSNAAQAQPELSEEEIRALVTEQYPGTITEVDIDKGFNKVVYEVEVESDGKEYEIKLDGNTGEVLKLEEKETRSNNNNSSELAIKEKDNADDKSKNDNADDKKKEDVNTDKSKDKKRAAISTDEAKKIALAEFNGTIKELELDEDDDRLIYEIEIKSENGEAEMDIDAYTGEIISISIDRVITETIEKNTDTEQPATNKPADKNPATSKPAKSNDDDNDDDRDDDYDDDRDDDDDDDNNDDDGDDD
ncbi:PepSY domain-containing protein [Paucisalibacillus sp. EB02]|uniref:PepSY domain-containing protein n=1 Tax=Paucisalibacillus sp. EB02 TaxID=1347087 RepID=UPI0004B08B31|nr:PepSY domain-containing protein [Paucisalibacillus sp. EB02]